MSSLLNASVLLLYSSSPGFVLGFFFMVFIPLLNVLFCPYIVFLMSFSCLSVLSFISLSFYMMIILDSLSGNTSVSISLGLVIGVSLGSSGGVRFT